MVSSKNEIIEVAARIAARSGVSVESVMAAYRNAARGAAVNASALFLD